MIKANELRIGNLVLSSGYPLRIDSIGKWYVTADVGMLTYMYEIIEPIPLTPEILGKAGLSEIGRIRLADRRFLEIDPRLDTNRVFLTELNTHSYIDTILLPIEIEYLHQLQNLYFALTGEELTISL